MTILVWKRDEAVHAKLIRYGEKKEKLRLEEEGLEFVEYSYDLPIPNNSYTIIRVY